jgi:hypothetical protein
MTSITSTVLARVGDGTAVEVTVSVGTKVTVREGTVVDVSDVTGVTVAVVEGVLVWVGAGVPVVAPGMTAFITIRMVITNAIAPVVIVTRTETISASSLPDILFHLQYLGPGAANQLCS